MKIEKFYRILQLFFIFAFIKKNIFFMFVSLIVSKTKIEETTYYLYLFNKTKKKRW